MNLEEQWLVLDVNPEPWAVGPLYVGKKNGNFFPQMGRNEQLHSYKEALKEAFLALPDSHVMSKDFYFDLELFFWRKIETYSNVETGRKNSAHVADATNLQKATEDGLQGLLYDNDRDVRHVQSWIIEQGPDVTPCVLVHASICDVNQGLNRIPEGIRYNIENPPQPRGRASDTNAWPPS